MTALLEIDRISKSFSGLKAVQDVQLRSARGRDRRADRPQRRRQDHLLQSGRRASIAPDAGEIRFAGKRIDGWRPDQICRAGIGRTFQLVKPFAGSR